MRRLMKFMHTIGAIGLTGAMACLLVLLSFTPAPTSLSEYALMRAAMGGVTIIDDFAHHPTAIRVTLQALRQVYPTSRLWAVLEPRSNTLRRNVFQQELIESLGLADRVILAAVYQQQRIPEGERLHPEQVIAALNAAGTPAELCADVAAIVDALDRQLQHGDVVAILSNGGFDGIYDKLPARLAQRLARASGMLAQA